MDNQLSIARDKVRIIREGLAHLMETKYGQELNALDEFLYFAGEWQEGFMKFVQFDPQSMYSPIASRDAALAVLFTESMLTAIELSTLLRHGLLRPAMVALRKLYEAHIDAQFIELDLTGYVAFRWNHWGVAHRAKLRPDDENAQKDRAASKKLFKGEREFGWHGYWAKVPSGQTMKRYHSLALRAKYVDDSNQVRFGSDQHADFAASWRQKLLAETNALVHPTVAGQEDILGPRIITYLTANYTFLTLITFKNGVDDHTIMPLNGTRGERLFSYPPGNDYLLSVAEQVDQAFRRLVELVISEV